MPYYRAVGDVPTKRHVEVHGADGHRYHEELMGQEGFSSASALLYHRNSPSAIVAVEPAAGPPEDPGRPDHPVVPRHLRTSDLPGGDDLVGGRTRLLANADVAITWVVAAGPGPLYRNAVGDELVYVQEGSASLESVFGALAVGPGDYVVVPRGATHRWVPDGGPVAALVVESSGHLRPPDRYRSTAGQFLEHAPYCERDLRGPTEPLLREGTEVEVLVRTRAGLSRHVHATHPFDVVGWDGSLWPWLLNIGDFEPVVGRLHQPPPVHQTFAGPGLVVCSFVPRLFDFHPDAVKVPYHHHNTDSDEVLFYSSGDFMSRAGAGIEVGSLTFHPSGFVHGPQPGSVEASRTKDRTEETAVMIDTFAPPGITDAARAVAAEDYPWSWAAQP